jgi:hypothetical protein
MRHPRLPALVSSALVFTLLSGCEGEKRYLPKKTADGALESASEPAPPAKPRIELRPVIRETTSEIKDAPKEIQQGGAQVSSGKITAKDPITLQGNAYVSIVGRAAVGNIQKALDLYQATNERYPADLNEFMNEIIKPNGIRLPQLPYYQEYGYDAPNHRLVVLEYPERKEQFQRQQDQELGRSPR